MKFSGVDQHLVEKILNPKYLDGEAATFQNLQNTLKSGTSSATAWVGEAGGAYNSGRDHVTNAFVFSFWSVIFIKNEPMSFLQNFRLLLDHLLWHLGTWISLEWLLLTTRKLTVDKA